MSKVWFITGSSRGFGAELVRAVLAHGDRVVATARKPEQLLALIEGHEDRARVFELDVTDAEAAAAAVDFAVAEFGRIDVVVNNAGYANSAPIEEVDPADFRAQIEANLFGVVNVTRAALPVLRDAAIRCVRSVLVDRRTRRRHSRFGCLPSGEVRGRGFLGSARRRSRRRSA